VKILIVHQYYLMPGQPGGSRFNEFARLWSERGHDVTVIAGTLDYATGKVPERYRRVWLSREEDGRVVVWRCHVPRSYRRGYVGRMWAFFGFTLSAATAALRVRNADVVIATSPPLVTALPGWVAARMRRSPAALIFEIRDLWPESAVTTGVLKARSLLTRVLYGLERWACRSADRISVLTPAFRQDLVKRGLATEQKIDVVPNGGDVELFRPALHGNALRAQLGWGDRFVVMYAGAHGRANALGQLLDAAERLRDRPEVLIALVGDGPERTALQAEARRRQLHNVTFCGPQPKERMPDFVSACNAGAAVLQDNPTFRTVYPNKVFDYMVCERPTLLAIDGVARQLVCEEARAGIFAKPEDGEAIAEAIRQLASDPAGCAEMGRRGREWVLKNATRDALAGRYLEAMEELRRQRGVALRCGPQTGWRRVVKEVIDRTAAALGLLCLWPLLALLATLVWARMGRPIFFRQERPGRGGSPFRLIKFRTMREVVGSSRHHLPDEQRLTFVGRFLRATSLDELPQLWNVLWGELSLVGPRPLLMQYLERYTPEQARRHEVKPGITGWAQINGRNALSWEEKFSFDVWYVEHWSLGLDVRILVRTLWRVFKQEGISREGYATMPEFLGSLAEGKNP